MEIEQIDKRVEQLVVAHAALTVSLDARLRSVEESAARAEAEVRFMATLLGDHVAGSQEHDSVDGLAQVLSVLTEDSAS